MSKLDLDFFEKVIFQQCLKKDSVYLASCIEHLDKSIFRNKDIGSIIDVVKQFYLDRDAIPTITEIKTRISTPSLKSALANAVNEIKDLDKDHNELELIKNTEYFLKQRKYYNLFETSLTDYAEKKEIESDEFQKNVEKINAISLIDNLGLDYFGDNERVVDYLQQRDLFISTGYSGLDEALGGGLMMDGRALYCIGGETNVGKSIVLANIAVNILLQNKNVLIYTLEMSEMRYAKRISSILTGIAIATLPDNIDNYKKYIEDFKAKYISKLIIKEFPTKSVNAKQLYAYTKTLEKKKGFKPNVLIFDYHTLMVPSVKQTAKHAEMQYITQECRGMTYALNAPGITVAQLNRSSHKSSDPGLDSTSGSWDMNSDFDGIANLSQTDQDRESNILRYSGKKARDGGKGKTGAFNIDYDTLKLTEEDDGSNGPIEDLPLSEDFDFLNTGN